MSHLDLRIAEENGLHVAVDLKTSRADLSAKESNLSSNQLQEANPKQAVEPTTNRDKVDDRH